MGTPEEHAQGIGNLVALFQYLETSLRAAIAQLGNLWKAPYDVFTLKVGDKVASDPFTNYDALSILINQFNKVVPAENRIDSSLVSLRDAIAHGRALAQVPGGSLLLIKFGKEDKAGMVEVEFSETMTEGWFASQKARLVDALRKVSRYAV